MKTTDFPMHLRPGKMQSWRS